jgi:hypothetical protein
MTTLLMKTITSGCALTDTSSFDTSVNTFLATITPSNLINIKYKIIKGGSGDYYYCFVTYTQ